MHTRLIITCAIVVSLCLGCKNDSYEIKSFRPSSSYSLIDHFKIKDDSIIATDYLGTKYDGIITEDSTAQFKINNIIMSYPVRRTVSDTFYFGSSEFIEFIDIDDDVNIYFNHYTKLHTGVVYPFSPHALERRLVIKLRNQSNAKQLVLGGRYSSLDELSLYAPNIICSGSSPKTVSYEDVLMLVEKNASVKDLLNVQQQLFTNNRIDRSIIIASPVSLAQYSVIIDYKINNYSLVEDLYQRHQNYLNLDLPKRPQVMWNESYDELILSQEIVEIKVKDVYDLEKQEYRFKNSAKIAVRINEDMRMEDYLLVLVRLQELRLQYGGDFRTHYYE